MVLPGQPVARLADPLLALRVALLRAQLLEVQLRLRAVEYRDQVQAQTLRQQVTYFSSNLADAEQRQSGLVVTSAHEGVLLIDTPQDLDGRYLRRGELVGTTLDPHGAIIRVIVPQSEIELVRQTSGDIGLRFASAPEQVWHVPAIAREVPTATRDLPSAALSSFGGGAVEVDPGDQKHLKAIEVVFVLDVPVPPELSISRIGERVHVRFDHGSRTIGWRLARSARQTVLRRFDL
jgi:putative peptide zinc metalloprotease protein